MKQFIVLCSMILLGAAIFSMIMGDHEGSVISAVKDLWQGELAIRARMP